MNTVHHSPQGNHGRPQRLRGVVVGAHRMAKTVTVAVERLVWHTKLHKQFRKTKTLLVHDEKGEANMGDRVVIEQSRPISRRKHFRVVDIMKNRNPASESRVSGAPDSRAPLGGEKDAWKEEPEGGSSFQEKP